MAARRDLNTPPHAFTRAVGAMRNARLRPEVTWEEAPAPKRVAPYAAAMTADVVVDGVELATGRLVVLHDPAGHEAWRGTFRCVAYVRAESDPELVDDALLGNVGWSWLIEALDAQSNYTAPSGTVTRVTSESFGGMAGEPARAEVEIRASWTPLGDDIGAHVAAWGELLCTAAGLPPLPPGVVPISHRRVRA